MVALTGSLRLEIRSSAVRQRCGRRLFCGIGTVKDDLHLVGKLSLSLVDHLAHRDVLRATCRVLLEHHGSDQRHEDLIVLHRLFQCYQLLELQGLLLNLSFGLLGLFVKHCFPLVFHFGHDCFDGCRRDVDSLIVWWLLGCSRLLNASSGHLTAIT